MAASAKREFSILSDGLNTGNAGADGSNLDAMIVAAVSGSALFFAIAMPVSAIAGVEPGLGLGTGPRLGNTGTAVASGSSGLSLAAGTSAIFTPGNELAFLPFDRAVAVASARRVSFFRGTFFGIFLAGLLAAIRIEAFSSSSSSPPPNMRLKNPPFFERDEDERFDATKIGPPVLLRLLYLAKAY